MPQKARKVRIDKLLVDRELVSTRQKAQALVMGGCVLVDNVPVTKAGQLVYPNIVIRIKGRAHPYVSRGGVKLEHALKSLDCNVRGKVCMDVGASTGGFTDCLLQNGATRVYAVDVGYGQLATKLVRDKRVVMVERANIRHMGSERIPDAVEVAVIDVSFISLTLVLPVVELFLTPGASIVALIKPQFEVGRELVGKGGVVRDPELHALAVNKVKEAGLALGWRFEGVVDSPILGAKGNREFFIYFKKKI